MWRQYARPAGAGPRYLGERRRVPHRRPGILFVERIEAGAIGRPRQPRSDHQRGGTGCRRLAAPGDHQLGPVPQQLRLDLGIAADDRHQPRAGPQRRGAAQDRGARCTRAAADDRHVPALALVRAGSQAREPRPHLRRPEQNRRVTCPRGQQADVGDDHRPDVRARRRQVQARLAALEGDGDVGPQRRTRGRAGVGVDATRQVDGDPRRVGGVGPPDRRVVRLAQRRPGPGAEHRVDDHHRPHQRRQRVVERHAHPPRDRQLLHERLTAPLRQHVQLHRHAAAVEDTGDRRPVRAVVAGPAQHVHRTARTHARDRSDAGQRGALDQHR